VDSPLAYARDLDAEPARVEVVPVAAAPSSIAIDLGARIVFRGQAISTLETLELVPRRFTVKLGAHDGEARILGLWEHANGRPSIHRLRIGDRIHELDPEGNPHEKLPIATLISQLGITDSAAHNLLAAGADAVVPLCKVAEDTQQPTSVRALAVVILGQLSEPGALSTLTALAQHTDLGDAATQALNTLRAPQS